LRSDAGGRRLRRDAERECENEQEESHKIRQVNSVV
jgi:hypothetical protein